MFLSAALSFILYSLVFFRLRGNITVSAGYKFEFHRRAKVKIGKTSNGTYIMTDDQRIESHLTKVAKHMLWYPCVYTIVILPMGATRFTTFSGVSVPSAVTIFAAALFMLHGFINMLLFCTTRNILPGTWRQRLGLSSTWSVGRSELDLSSLANATWRFPGLGTRTGAVSAGTAPVVLSVGVEKDVEIAYEEALPSPGYIKFRPLLPHSPLPRSYDGGERRADTKRHHSRQFSFPTSRDGRRSIHIEVEKVDDGHSPGTEASKQMTTEQGVPLRPVGRVYYQHESGIYGPTPALAAPHPYSMTPPTETTDKRTTRSHP